MSKPTAIDLFSGAGGLASGLISAGFKLLAAVESDPWAAKTYRENIGNHVLEKDIRFIQIDELLRFAGLNNATCDLLAGGPPCQGFSVQRRGADEDPRNSLVLEFLRFVQGIRPRFFLMENVTGLASKRGQPFLQQILLKAGEIGYVTHLMKLDAISFGVPQYRKRTILVGELVDSGAARFEPPQELLQPSEYKTVRDAIGDLPSPPADGSPHRKVLNHAREAKLSLINIERLKHIPPGGGREHLPDHLQLPCHKQNPTHRHMDVYGRLAWDRPSGTITARFDSFTRGRFAHPLENRSLTLREGARLQTFPDNFVFFGNKEEVAKQIGNAVPPKLAEVLGIAVARALKPMKSVTTATKAHQALGEQLTITL